MDPRKKDRFGGPTTAARLAVLAALLALTGPGCGPRMPPASEPREEVEGTGALRTPITLETVHVRATRDRGRLVITAYSATELFEEATRSFRAGEFAPAVEFYARLATEFGDSPLAEPALYNSGLARERLGDFEGASRDYLRLVEGYPGSPDVTDALFRAGGALEKLEAWDDATRTFGRILTERENLGTVDRVEALARKGSSLLAGGNPRDAKAALEEATLLYRAGRGVTPSSPTFHYAMAQFKLGELIHAEMRAVELPMDGAVLEAALERKCRLLLDSQAEYTKAIEILHPHWAAAAAYRIGGLYRNLWDDLLAAPLPENLTGEEQEVYREVLRGRIRVLLVKAVAQWERTLKMIRRLELEGEWAERTERDLVEIRELMAIEDAELAAVPPAE
jgi:tetratricopeptide (TPR) repeat protein